MLQTVNIDYTFFDSGIQSSLLKTKCGKNSNCGHVQIKRFFCFILQLSTSLPNYKHCKALIVNHGKPITSCTFGF